MIDVVDPATLVETTRQTAKLAQSAADTANFYALITLVVQTIGAIGLGYIGLKTALINKSQGAIVEGQKTVESKIDMLEKNTNSKMDKFIKETQEAYLAKGILEEKNRDNKK